MKARVIHFEGRQWAPYKKVDVRVCGSTNSTWIVDMPEATSPLEFDKDSLQLVVNEQLNPMMTLEFY
jgi:hypothetical protein